MGETIAVAIILSLSFTNPYHILEVGGYHHRVRS